MRRARLVFVLGLAALGGCRRQARQDAALLAENQRLRQRLDQALTHDPLVAAVTSRPGDVHVSIRADLAAAVVKAVARRYLDRVELDLPLEQVVHETGTLKTGTFLGKMKAGEWDVTVVIHRVRGVMSAGEPILSVAPGNRLRVQMPVTIQKSEGAATVKFKWDSTGLANVVCHDFEVSRDIRGRLISSAYTLDGMMQLGAGPQSLRADPTFPRSVFRLQVDLEPASWENVKTALAEQDKLLKCGMGLDPDKVLPYLSGLLAKGFDLHLPRSLFRSVDLPGSVGGTGSLDGHEVQVTVATEALEVGPQALWYSASVRSQAVPPAPPTP